MREVLPEQAVLATVDLSTGEIVSPVDVQLPAPTAESINEAHRLAHASAENAKECAVRCGLLLIQKKKELPRGQFIPWIEAQCDFSVATANNYMKVARNPNALGNSIRHLFPSGQPSSQEPQHQREPEPLPIDGVTTNDLDDLKDAHYGTIYADPPWQYGNQGTRAAQGNHYGGMSVDDICALPIGRLAQPRSHLHLWTTNAFLFEARRVMEAWGFEYKSCFVWVKPQMGIGNYWRVSHEFMLLGVRGSLPFHDKSLMSWASIPRTKHSAKPEEVREFIQRASPGPYLELFARRPAVGWTVWGNEISREVFAA